MYAPTLDRTIVITAYGFCSPVGLDDAELGASLAAREEPSCPTRTLCDKTLDAALAQQIPWAEQRRMDRLTKLGVQASMTCFRRSGLTVDDENCEHVGGVFATVFGPIASVRDFMRSGMEKGIRGASPLLFPYTVSNACSGIVTILLGLRGFSTTVAGSNPLCYAFDALRGNRADALVAGGFDELIPEIRDAFMNPLVAEDDAPADPVRPLSEGAAVVMMETLGHARRRGAEILCEMLGWGQALNLSAEPASVDYLGPIDPAAIDAAMRQALKMAGCKPGEVRMVVSLARLDNRQTESEAEALRAVFGEGGAAPVVRYPKRVLGETFAASDTFGVIAALMYTAEQAAETEEKGGRVVVVNGFQLGGNVSAVVLRV